MSSKYSRTLFTTSILAFGLISAAPSHAGFEWTPPEKKEVPAPVVRDVPPAVVPAPVIRAPLVEPEVIPVVPSPEPSVEMVEPVLEMPTEAVDVPEPVSKPAVQIEEPAIAIPLEPAQEQPVSISESTVEETVPVLDDLDGDMEMDVSDVPEPIVTDVPAEINIEDDLKDDAEMVSEDTSETVQSAADSVPVVIDDTAMETEQSVESVLLEAEETVPSEDVIEDAIEEIEVVEPAQNSDKLSIKPFPETDTTGVSSDAVVLPADEDVDIKDLQPEDVVMKDEIRVQDSAPMENISWEIPEDFYTIEGFGSDLPLALALRQIVPAHYAFSFGSGVNPGEPVSWDGGKPWNEVLADTLDSIDVVYTLKDKKVVLKKQAVPMDDKQGALDSAEEEAVKVASLVHAQDKPAAKQAPSLMPEKDLAAHVDVTTIEPKLKSIEQDADSPLDKIYGKKTDDPYKDIKASSVVPEPKPENPDQITNAAVSSGAKKK